MKSLPFMHVGKIPFATIIATLSIIMNVALGTAFLVRTPSPKPPVSPPPHQENSSDYPLLSKRIFAENQNDLLVNFIPLRSALYEYVNKLEDPVGVYFEYLPSGTSIGVNDKMEVRLASLIKTPLVMGVYKEIEKGTLSKDTMITLTKDDLDPKFGNLWRRGEGAKLTIKEAIDSALMQSDNTAANALLSTIPLGAVDNIFDNLDIATNNTGGVNLVTPKSYSSIFRSLYISSSLHKNSSNEILDILTRTDFNDQIAAGVPNHIKVSHKIGVFDSENIHSDCGIVYAPERPYLLCIMSRSSKEKSREYMQHISKMIYGYIAAARVSE